MNDTNTTHENVDAHQTIQGLLDLVGGKHNATNKFSSSIYLAPSNLDGQNPSSKEMDDINTTNERVDVHQTIKGLLDRYGGKHNVTTKLSSSIYLAHSNPNSEKGNENGDVHQTVKVLLDLVGGKHKSINKFSSSIYMAPSNFKALNPSSFQPRVVSIGPLHREDRNLQRFEVRKASFVHDLLCRRLDSSPEQTLTACVKEVTEKIEEIRRCYAFMPKVNDNELAKIMVMDACFILEFIHKMPKDPSLRLQDQHIPYDLVLLENQIPFFVLQSVYECTIYNFEEHVSLTAFIHPILKYINLFEGELKIGGSRSYADHDHILGYLYHCYQPKKDIPTGLPHSTIHSAVELIQAGVTIKPNKEVEWPMDMKVKWSDYPSILYCCSFKPTLKMPVLRINDFTELVLRNLITYEQSYGLYPYVTSYARAMDMLVDDKEDIAKLVASKVVINHIGSNEEAATMINRICKEVAPEHFCYRQEWEDLDTHLKKYWPSMIVNLKQNYFNSPWSLIAVLAGFLIFGLTVTQTIFSIKAA